MDRWLNQRLTRIAWAAQAHFYVANGLDQAADAPISQTPVEVYLTTDAGNEGILFRGWNTATIEAEAVASALDDK